MNKILQTKTVEVNGPAGPMHGMMIAVAVGDARTAVNFVATVAEQFKVDRTLAPPNTKLLLITLVGPLTAPSFALRWGALEANDKILRIYMGLMIQADVIQGDEQGKELSTASLL